MSIRESTELAPIVRIIDTAKHFHNKKMMQANNKRKRVFSGKRYAASAGRLAVLKEELASKKKERAQIEPGYTNHVLDGEILRLEHEYYSLRVKSRAAATEETLRCLEAEFLAHKCACRMLQLMEDDRELHCLVYDDCVKKNVSFSSLCWEDLFEYRKNNKKDDVQ